MKLLLKIILLLIIAAAIGDFVIYIYRIGTAPEPYRSTNPFLQYEG